MSDLQAYLDKALKNISFHDDRTETSLFEYDIEAEVRQLIVSTRTDLGITQKQLSNKTGLSQSNISKIENGTYHPSLTTLKRIADGFGKKLTIQFEDMEVIE